MSPVKIRPSALISGLLLYCFASTLFAYSLSKSVLINEINTVFLADSRVELVITGQNFLGKKSEQPSILIGHHRDFTLVSVSDRQIVLTAELPAGDYLLRISDKKYFTPGKGAEFDFTIGEPGVSGAAGIAGIAGDRGEAGPVGPVGKQGPQGLTGPAGSAGPRGEPGATGAKGPPGEQGPEGERGLRGLRGPSGTDGHPGSPGPAPEFHWQAGALSVGHNVNGYWEGDFPPVSLTDQQSGMDISQLCTMATFQFINAARQPIQAGGEFGFVFPLADVRRICLNQCPVAYSNLLNLVNFTTRHWDEVDPWSEFPKQVEDTLASFVQGPAQMFCASLLNQFWNAKLDDWQTTISSADKVNINATHYAMNQVVSLIEGDGSQYTYIGNYHRGFYSQPYPDVLAELLEDIPWTIVHTTWAYPYSGTTQPFYDGWGRKLQYTYGGETALAYSLISAGSDGLFETADDIRYDSLNGYTPLPTHDQLQQDVLANILDTGFGLERIKTALQQYARYIGNGQFPAALDPLVTAGLLDELPTDAWNRAIEYIHDGANNSFTVKSIAKDLSLITGSFDLLDETQIEDFLSCDSDESCIKTLQP